MDRRFANGKIRVLRMRTRVLRSRALRRLAKQTVGCLRIPEDLQTSITGYLQDFPKHRIKQHVAQLSLMLKTVKVKETPENELVPVWRPSEAIQAAAEEYLMRKPFKTLPAKVHVSTHRKIKYEQRHTVAYVASRMPASYAVVQRTFAEIARRIPDFKPCSVLDYGSGPGTTVWALRDVWPGAVEHVTTIETSPHMAAASKKIFQGMDEVPPIHNHRSLQALNRTRRCKHDLVIAAYAIGELKEVKDQLTIARQLWSLTRDILVLIEPGTSEGSLTIRGIRAHILALERKKLMRRKSVLALASPEKTTKDGSEEVTPEEKASSISLFSDRPGDTGGAYVVAPCPHDGVCPMDGTKQWCHFVQRLERTLTQRVAKKHSPRMLRGFEDEKYTYVVLRRGHRPNLKWPLEDVELRMEKELPPTGYFATDAEDSDEEDEEGDESDQDEDEEAINGSRDETETETDEERVEETIASGDHQNREGSKRTVEEVFASGRFREEPEDETEAEAEDDEPEEEGDEEEEEDESDDEELMERYPGDPKPKPVEDDDVEESTEPYANLAGGWGRVIFRPYKRGRHVVLDVCRSTDRDASSGSFKRMIFTRSKHRVLHREAKKTRWGDLWPCQ